MAGTDTSSQAVLPNPPPAASDRWRKAAVIGGLWAGSEIVLGSFLHNLRLPLGGHVLTVIAVALLAATRRRWPQPGLAWRAGLIAAIMKSVSPSAVLLGPMVAISMEGLLFEVGTRIGRRSWPACAVGGALAMCWTFLHQIGSLLIAFGPDLVAIYGRLVTVAQSTIGYPVLGHWGPIAGVLVIEIAIGAAAGILGWRAGSGATERIAAAGLPAPRRDRRFAPGPKPSWLALGVLLAGLPLGLVALNRLPLAAATVAIAVALAMLGWHDRRVVRRLGRPGLWIAIFAVAAAAALTSATATGSESGWAAAIGAALRLTTRALFVTAWFGALAAELAHPQLRELARRWGSAPLFDALELAFASLPEVVASLPAARDILRRPGAALAALVADLDLRLARLPTAGAPLLIVLTGPRAAGKTTCATQLVAALRHSGLQVAGVLAPGTLRNGSRRSFDLVDLASGRQTPWASRDRRPGWHDRGGFWISPQGLAAGRRALTEVGDADVVVIDEVGPWELAGDGWAPQLDRLTPTLQPLVLVVRRSLVSRVTERWGGNRRLLVVSTDEPSLDTITRELIQAARRESPAGRRADPVTTGPRP